LVLEKTGADALMIGRAAQGRPWIFREILHFLKTGQHLPAPMIAEIQGIMNHHLLDHYAFYGEYAGVRSARKHIAWYCKGLKGSHAFRHHMNTIDDCQKQLIAVNHFFDSLKEDSEQLIYLEAA
jgi:tRNA-dihydrouridine synthase B